MFFKEKIKPPLVLTLICLITCGLLVAAYEATYVDNTGIITEKLRTGLTEVYGKFEDFEMLLNDDGTVLTYDGVTSVLSDGKYTAFEITADGYSKGGLHVLVGLDENGAVKGVSIMTIGETPGLGTKMCDEGNALISSIKDKDADELKFSVKKDGGELDALTAATISSRAYYDAVARAHKAFQVASGQKAWADGDTGATASAENNEGEAAQKGGKDE